MNIALIGPSGAGKGTQVNKLVAKFGFLHLSPGDLFRENVQNQTALGIIAKKYMKRGELVSDEVVDAMIEEQLRKADPDQGILFDGFPATIDQAQFLEELFVELGRSLDAAIYLDVLKETIEERLSGRMICRKCYAPFHKVYHPYETCLQDQCQGEFLYQRDEDTSDIARARLGLFYRKVTPLVAYYQKQRKLMIVDANKGIDQIHNTLVGAVESIRGHKAQVATHIEMARIQALKPVVERLSWETAPPGLDLVLFGAPGSGKGTQAEKLSQSFNLPHIATGDIFRENLQNGTDLGKLARTYMDRGELVPDDVTEGMVQNRLSQADTATGFILDGFPRTRHQAEALTGMLTTMQRRLTGVLYIKVPDEAIVNRLSGRLVCRECQAVYHLQFKPPAQENTCNLCGGELYQRDDDNPATVRARLRTFHRQTEPLLAYYEQAGLLIEIDAMADIEVVTDRLLTTIQDLKETIAVAEGLVNLVPG